MSKLTLLAGKRLEKGGSAAITPADIDAIYDARPDGTGSRNSLWSSQEWADAYPPVEVVDWDGSELEMYGANICGDGVAYYVEPSHPCVMIRMVKPKCPHCGEVL